MLPGVNTDQVSRPVTTSHATINANVKLHVQQHSFIHIHPHIPNTKPHMSIASGLLKKNVLQELHMELYKVYLRVNYYCYYCTILYPKKKKNKEKECTSVMYTIVYTKYIWTQVPLITDTRVDNYKYI